MHGGIEFVPSPQCRIINKKLDEPPANPKHNRGGQYNPAERGGLEQCLCEEQRDASHQHQGESDEEAVDNKYLAVQERQLGQVCFPLKALAKSSMRDAKDDQQRSNDFQMKFNRHVRAPHSTHPQTESSSFLPPIQNLPQSQHTTPH